MVLPCHPKAAPWDAPGSVPHFAGQQPASLLSCYRTWYHSWWRLLDNMTADAQLMQTLGRQGRAERDFLLYFFSHSFLLFHNSNEQQHLKCSLWAATAAAPSRAPAARPRCSVRNADPLDIVISVNICRCFRAGTCVRLGTPAGSVAFLHGFPSLWRKRQMIPMDHGG